jgi:sulfite reductase alpha subunit-like flavoprotein
MTNNNLDLNKLKNLVKNLTKSEIIWLNGYMSAKLEGEVLTTENDNVVKPLLNVFYATETGNSKQVANKIANHFKANHFIVKINDLELYKRAKVDKSELAVFIMPTHGEGEFPEAVMDFVNYLDKDQPNLKKLRYGLLSLGDNSYPLFCQAGKDLETKLNNLGAVSLLDRVDFDVDFEADLTNWLNNSIEKFGGMAKADIIAETISDNISTINPKTIFTGVIGENVNLNDKGSNLENRHIEIIPDQDVPYKPGDAISILLDENDNVIQDISTVKGKIAPRLYSIASSAEYHDGEIHLIVKVVQYKDEHGKIHKGLCSNYLSELKEGDKLNFSIKPNDVFRLAEDSKDVIMVGPGTGIAPFRGFLSERAARGASGKNWLFFGTQHFATDFLYQTEIQEFVEQGILNNISLAFSRDQKEKIYVQNRIKESGEELFAWLEAGAYFYVCGEKANMAKDVEQELLNAIATYGKLDEEQSHEYLLNLKEQGRYLRDVY